MPPVTILSPYSGRPVKVREQDLGRALRDEQGRVFYIVEDPEHGRYAARTRKGSPKDLERYREIESGVAKLGSDEDRPATNAMQVHDATGSKRRNPVGLLLLVLILAAVTALGYVYAKHPEWLGLGTPASDTEPGANDEAALTEPAPIKPVAIAPIVCKTEPADPLITAEPVHTEPARPAMPDGMDDDPEPVF
nr:hypothetical protein [Phycisphaeraceae bacterium]